MTALQADRNIILTGFMGTGKTTVGRLLARRLGREFVDMDDVLETQFGKSISEVFAEFGEPAFRAEESRLCQRYAVRSAIVLSTGGGVLLDPANLRALGSSGTLICLTASVDTILARLEQMSDRPLLPGDWEQKRKTIRDLLQVRRQAYAATPHHVDTDNATPAEIVDRILQALEDEMEAPGMTRLPVRGPGGTYDICLGHGLLEHIGPLLMSRGLREGAAAIVTNETIAELYGGVVEESLRQAGFEPVVVCRVQEGEQFKTLQTVTTLYNQLVEANLDRNSPVVAIGGGVIGDIAGFAAATYLRGVPFVQVPTSLLAMVDASVGGKTGVDLPQGKNLVGAFKQPHAVVIDPDVLETLPAAEFRSGLAEVIKHGIIGAPDLFAQLEDHGPNAMTHLIADAVRVKVAIVEEDPLERGRRNVLNLGHTFGHAMEVASGYTLRHGEAVALGLIAAARLSLSLSRCTPATYDRIRSVVDRLGLSVCFEFSEPDTIMAGMTHDKKRSGKTLRFIIPQDIGDVVMIDDPGTDLVRAALLDVLAS